MTSPTLSQAELREAVARLIDPHAWGLWLEGDRRHIPGDAVAGRKRVRAFSLAKADEILRLVSSAGGVLVPVEPTMDQLAAGYEAMFDGKWDCSQAPMMGAGYDAMIAAAPPFTKEG